MTPLYGHEDAVAAFRAALDSKRLHHAWLLAGPEGVGKALFADKAALRVLAEGAGPPVDAPGLDVPDDHPVAKLAAAGSHPDLMRLERLTKEGGTELARSITVEQVRGLHRLFATTTSLSPRRAVVIDAIDDLERNAANALLKNLEEPPPGTLFLVVSHSPGRLLPTIRSRCRTLRFQPLSETEVGIVLQQNENGLRSVKSRLDLLDLPHGSGQPDMPSEVRFQEFLERDEVRKRFVLFENLVGV